MSEPSARELYLIHEKIEARDFHGALRLINKSLSARTPTASTRYKAWRAYCLLGIGQADEALIAANELLELKPNDLYDPGTIASLVSIYQYYGGHQCQGRIQELYCGAWQTQGGAEVGEAYALALASTRDYGAFRAVALRLLQNTGEYRFRVWMTVSNVLEENTTHHVLGLRLLQKICLSEDIIRVMPSLLERQQMAYLYMYAAMQCIEESSQICGQSSATERNGIGHLEQCSLCIFSEEILAYDLSDQSNKNTFTRTNVWQSLGLPLGWALATLLDEFIRKTKALCSQCVIKSQSMARFLLTSRKIRADVKNTLFLDVTENAKYFHCFIQTYSKQEGVQLLALETQCSDTPEWVRRKETPPTVYEAVKTLQFSDDRLKDSTYLEALLRSAPDAEKWCDTLLDFLSKWGRKNTWVCYMDVKLPILRYLGKRHCETSLHEQIELLDSALTKCGSISLVLQMHLLLLVHARSVSPSVLKERNWSELILQCEKKCEPSLHRNFVIVWALLHKRQTWAAMSFLEDSPELKEDSSNILLLLNCVLGGRQLCFDMKIPQVLGLRSIQLETLHFLYFYTLRDSLFLPLLHESCESACVFYNETLRRELYELRSSSIRRGAWHLLVHELPLFQKKIEYSLHRIESIIYGVLCFIARFPSNEAERKLKQTVGLVEDFKEYFPIIATNSSAIVINDETNILENEFWEIEAELLPLECRKEKRMRIADVLRLGEFIHKLLFENVSARVLLAFFSSEAAKFNDFNESLNISDASCLTLLSNACFSYIPLILYTLRTQKSELEVHSMFLTLVEMAQRSLRYVLNGAQHALASLPEWLEEKVSLVNYATGASARLSDSLGESSKKFMVKARKRYGDHIQRILIHHKQKSEDLERIVSDLS